MPEWAAMCPWSSSFLLLSVCVQAFKKGQWIKTPHAAFCFFNGWVPDGHVTPEHTYSTRTSGTTLPTESFVCSPRGAGKSCTCSSLLHKEVSLTVTCHCSSKLISCLHMQMVNVMGETTGEAVCSKSGKGLTPFLSSNVFGLHAFAGNQAWNP